MALPFIYIAQDFILGLTTISLPFFNVIKVWAKMKGRINITFIHISIQQQWAATQPYIDRLKEENMKILEGKKYEVK